MNFFKNLFESKVIKSDILFIVEDNPAYAKTLELSIKSSLSEIKEIKIFPEGETCIMELDKNPRAIIIDYFLDSKYHDALTGLEIIKKIRALKPEMNIIVLSAQKDIEVVLETVRTYKCSYIKKDEKAFERIEEILKEI